MASHYGPTASQFQNILAAYLSNIHDVTVTEVPNDVERMRTFYVASYPAEYIRYVYYDSDDTKRRWNLTLDSSRRACSIYMSGRV